MLRHYSRHYYISDDLDDLEHVEEELEAHSVSVSQIHVLSEQDSEVEHHHHLHAVPSLMKNDVVHSTEIGAVVGVVAASLVLAVVYFAGWTENVGWMAFIFLAIVVLGFCTWEGALYGIQIPNQKFLRFEKELHRGKHIFFVDIESKQETVLNYVLKHHPKLVPCGTGGATPDWLLQLQCNWHDFRKVFP